MHTSIVMWTKTALHTIMKTSVFFLRCGYFIYKLSGKAPYKTFSFPETTQPYLFQILFDITVLLLTHTTHSHPPISLFLYPSNPFFNCLLKTFRCSLRDHCIIIHFWVTTVDMQSLVESLVFLIPATTCHDNISLVSLSCHLVCTVYRLWWLCSGQSYSLVWNDWHHLLQVSRLKSWLHRGPGEL